MKYLLIDASNLFFRGRHVAARNTTTEEKLGMALHLTLNAANSMFKRFGADHVVVCLEGRSWRKDFYKPYKANRAAKRAQHTVAEAEEDRLFWETYDEMCTYLRDKTNVSVLQNPIAEADDLIARFIALHPNDHHIIVSSDTDFIQLIAPNVDQYNGITDQYLTVDGYHDHKGNLVKDKKTGEPKTLGDPQFVLFEKCMRGDTSDNIFSAYPGVRTKGTKNKIGLTEAYSDRSNRGFAWNNMMLQRWTDHEGVEHRVLDDYNRNCQLIDLTAQPQDIKDVIDVAIASGLRHTTIPQVGVHFMRFCGKHELVKLSEQADSFARWLNAPYTGDLPCPTDN